MDTAAMERQWDHTAALMAFIANIANSFSDNDAPAVTVAQLHPLRQQAMEHRSNRRRPFEHLRKVIGTNGNGRSD